MNGSGSNQQAEQSAQDAAAWHVRLDSSDATEADFSAFEVWVSNPDNRAAFDSIDSLNVLLEAESASIRKALDAPAADVVRFDPERRVSKSPANPSRRFLIGGALAAGIAALAIAPKLLSPQLRWTTYSTAAGETRSVTLEDGSVVTLNGASSLKVAFSPAERRVEMADAEATFDVAKNPGRPFLIGARGHEIRVVGTEFNVFNFDGATRVSVRRGIVQVRRTGDPHVARLTAGREYAQSGAAPAIVRACDPDNAFAWRTGQLVYDDARLTDVVSALNRRFKTPVRLQGSAGDLRFTGVLSLDSEEAVVRRLEAFLPVSAERASDQYILRAR